MLYKKCSEFGEIDFYTECYGECRYDVCFFCSASLEAAIDCMSFAYAIEVDSLYMTSLGPFTLKMSCSSVSRAHCRMSMKQFQMSVLSTSPCPTPLFATKGGAGVLNTLVSVYDRAFPCAFICLFQCLFAAGLFMKVSVRALLSTKALHIVCGMPNLCRLSFDAMWLTLSKARVKSHEESAIRVAACSASSSAFISCMVASLHPLLRR